MSHQGRKYFLSVHRLSCLGFTDWLSIIWTGSFLSSPWTACQDEFPCLEYHLPWNYYGKVWVSWPTPFTTDIADEALKAYKKGPKRSPSTGRNWSTQFNTYRFSWPSVHQPVLVPAPSQPDSSYQSQVTLPPCPLSPGLCLHHGLHIKPHLVPHCSSIHHQFFSGFPTAILKPRLSHPFLSARLPFLLITWAASNWGREAERQDSPSPSLPQFLNMAAPAVVIFINATFNMEYISTEQLWTWVFQRTTTLLLFGSISWKWQETSGKPLMNFKSPLNTLEMLEHVRFSCYLD